MSSVKIRMLFLLIWLPLHGAGLTAQESETFILRHALSKKETVVYKRVIRFIKRRNLYQVKDYFESGQIQMAAFYSSFDKNIKEGIQCNYRSNTKEGRYAEWYRDGRIAFRANFENGLMNGPCTSWYENGKKEAAENWRRGQLHGRARYWTEKGKLQFDLMFDHGLNKAPKAVHYRYLSWLPKGYGADAAKKWPLVIYLHGGSGRGSDLNKLYADGVPDQIYRGRDFPFVVAAPQCPEHIRWSTEDWFEAFYREVTDKYQIDRDRVYLTGVSLGGAGTWYLAEKYADKFAAIAPMSGFTSHMDYIGENIDRLIGMPIWAFHGKIDVVVPFEETERVVNMLEGKNRDMRFSVEPDVGHWIHWLVYPGQELYDWFLKHTRRGQAVLIGQ
jgi:pimeloyl-ACP methyl ester carboxylesterase